MLGLRQMNLIPRRPQARLFTSMEVEDSSENSTTSAKDSAFVLKGSGIFTGNGRAIFAGILGGIFLVSVAGWIFREHLRTHHELDPIRQLMGVATRSVSRSPHSSA